MPTRELSLRLRHWQLPTGGAKQRHASPRLLAEFRSRPFAGAQERGWVEIINRGPKFLGGSAGTLLGI